MVINQKPVAINQDLKALRPRNGEITPGYLLYFLQSKAEYFENAGVGATVKGLTIADYQRLPIVLPPPVEQHRVVKLLDEADELRKLRAQADRRAAEPYPLDFSEDVWEQKMAYTKHGEELIEEFRYGTSIKSTEKGYPTLRIPNVVRQQIDLTDLKYVPVSKDEFERLKLHDGDLLFVRTNGNPEYVGRCAVFRSDDLKRYATQGENFIFASYLIRARPEEECY